MDSRVSREWWDAMEAGHRRARKARQIVCVCVCACVFFTLVSREAKRKATILGLPPYCGSPLLWRTPEQDGHDSPRSELTAVSKREKNWECLKIGDPPNWWALLLVSSEQGAASKKTRATQLQ